MIFVRVFDYISFLAFLALKNLVESRDVCCDRCEHIAFCCSMLNYVTANSVKCMLPMFADFQIRYYGQVKMKSADVPGDKAGL